MGRKQKPKEEIQREEQAGGGGQGWMMGRYRWKDR